MLVVLVVVADAIADTRANRAYQQDLTDTPTVLDETPTSQTTEVFDLREALVYEEPYFEPEPVLPPQLPTPQPAEVVATSSYSTSSWQRLSYDEIVAKWTPLVSQYDWPIEEALRVIHCESSGDALVRSSTGCVGLFQICSSSGQNEQYIDPVLNAQAAYSKYLDGLRRGNRWWHWNQFGSCGHFY